MNQSKSFVAVALALAGVALPQWLHAAQPSAERYIVKFVPGEAGEARASLSRANARVALELAEHDAVAVEMPRAALAGLSHNPNIEYIEPDVLRYPLALATPSTSSPYATGQLVPYGIQMVQADQVSDSLAGNRKVCIIDSGYDVAHEDLSANPVTGNDDPTGAGLWSTDELHHGTHVAGTIAAINNGIGVAGVTPNKSLRLHIVKVFGADGWAYSSTLVAAVDKCALAGANVISMSLGGSFSSRTESNAFDKYYKRSANSILAIAAAGNDGNSRTSYPAGYANVVSVAAVDSNMAWASFSQYNKDVELAAPGVGVLSTVPMGSGRESTLAVGGVGYASAAMDGSPLGSVSNKTMVDCGTGASACTGATGNICLIQRGTNTFAEKVLNCQSGGGVAAVIYNNVAGMLFGTMGGTATSIPSMGISDTDGALLKTRLTQTTAAAVSATNYAYYDGTSMATPHVSAVAALVWSYRPTCSAATLRNVLDGTAKDLGTTGRDTKYGFGLVQADAARTRLLSASTTCP